MNLYGNVKKPRIGEVKSYHAAMERSLALLGAVSLSVAACDESDLARLRDKSQGTLSVAPGMRISEVVKRSTLKLHKLPTLSSTVNYATGNAYFDFELAGSALRFHGCSMYSIDAEGPEETVSSINVFVTPGRLRWGAFVRELKDTAARLKADGWDAHVAKGRPTLEAFMAQDGSKIQTTPSDVVATFAWAKESWLLDLSAHRAWDGPQFWSSFDLSEERWLRPAEMWLSEFAAYPRARKVCSQHVLGSTGGTRREIAWSMYATKDRDSDVFSFYSSYGGWRGMASNLETEPLTLTLVAANGTRRLVVQPASGSHPDCGVRPEADEKTVLIVSGAP